MKKCYFLGVDIGSSQSKGVIVDEDAQVIAQHFVKHKMEQPFPGYFEHDAEAVWWGDFCQLTRRLLEISGLSGNNISCVGVSALGADCLPVDEYCRPYRKAILYGIDSRAEREIAYLDRVMPSTLLGRLDTPTFTTSDIPPKILWLKNHEWENYQNAYKFLSASCYLVAKLTGNYVVDTYTAMAGYAPLYHLNGIIDEEACSFICKPGQLPQYAWTAQIVGNITAEASKATGLCQGTKVTAGTDDMVAEFISAGLLGVGDVTLMLGSTMCIAAVVPKQVKDSRIGSQVFVIPNTAILSGTTNAAGNLTQWVRDLCFQDAVRIECEGGINAYDAMMESAADIPAGAEGLIMLPYLAGERSPINDPNAKGLIYGLTLRHTRNHIYRAALEAVGYSIKQHLDIFAEYDVHPRYLSVAGGGTKTPMWLQIIADITGIPVHVPRVTLGAAYGDALIAGIGFGCFENFGTLRQYMKTSQIFTPNPQNYKVYRNGYEIFNRLYPAAKAVEKNMIERVV